MACSSCLAFVCGIKASSENGLVNCENGHPPDLPSPEKVLVESDCIRDLQ